MSKEQHSVEIVILHNDPPCTKCVKTKSVVESACSAVDGDVTVREVVTGTDEAAQYGVVAPPMVLVNGKVASAGFTPMKAGLIKLLKAELAGK